MWTHFTDRPAIGLAVDELPKGNLAPYTWSLVTALSTFLDILTERYGPAVKDRMFLGIEFGGEQPRIWCPGSSYVVIKLSDDARLDVRQALYQLAHEAVHLLAPIPGDTIVAEEGLAVVFEREMVRRYELNFYGVEPAYSAAGAIAEQLLAVDVDIVKRIRQDEPMFSRWTSPLLEQHGVPRDLAHILCSPWDPFVQRVKSAIGSPGV